MQYDQKQFTQKGLDMFSSALSNKQSITVDKVIVDDLPTNNFSNLGLLSLDSFADAMSFQANYTETSNNTLTVDAVMSNKGFQSPYTVQEIGLVGHVGDDTNGQSLMAILVASDPFTLPAQQNDETPSQFIPNITIQLANNDMGQVPVLVQDDSYIAQKDLDKLVADNGYIKLTDADNRYVKQTDFDNEVNDAVNEKADKSDLNSLQNNINNDVQPQLNQKADQSDLNTTNGSVSSLQSNKADKGDVNSQINQTLSQATVHSDQNLSTANNHSDSNYNDLSNKNNILSQRVEDYQKPNLVDFSTNDWVDTGNASGVRFVKTNNIHLEAGKTYQFSIEYDAGDWGNSNASIVSDGLGQQWALGYNANQWFNNKNPTYKYVPQNDENISLELWRWGSQPNQFRYRHLQVTQTSDVIPYYISEQNKASIESEGQLTDDYQAPNLAPITEYEYNAWNAGGYGSKAPFSINVEQGKKYWFSLYVDKNDSNFASTSNGIGKVQGASAINPDVDTGKWHVSEGNYYICNWIADRTDSIDLSFATYNLTDTKVSKICITQSDEYVPFEVAQRNKLWNDRITNKTNDLSNTMNQQFNQATAHSDQNLSNVQGQIASIKANAWRELTVDGADGIILCKVDWSSNTAQLYGGISENSNTGNIIIRASDDFRFNDAGNVMQMRFNQKGTVSINSDGNIVWNNINMYNASLLFSGSTSLSYFDSSGVFDTTYTQGYGTIKCSISPK